jgi:hypothetical protein
MYDGENRMGSKLKEIRIIRRSPYYAGIPGTTSKTWAEVADRLVQEGYAEFVVKAVKRTRKKKTDV